MQTALYNTPCMPKERRFDAQPHNCSNEWSQIVWIQFSLFIIMKKASKTITSLSTYSYNLQSRIKLNLLSHFIILWLIWNKPNASKKKKAFPLVFLATGGKWDFCTDGSCCFKNPLTYFGNPHPHLCLSPLSRYTCRTCCQPWLCQQNSHGARRRQPATAF